MFEPDRLVKKRRLRNLNLEQIKEWELGHTHGPELPDDANYLSVRTDMRRTTLETFYQNLSNNV